MRKTEARASPESSRVAWRPLLRVALACWVSATGASAVAAIPATPQASSPAAVGVAPEMHRWLCEVVYLPARSTWRRELALGVDDRRVRAVWVDGQPVYSFQVQGTRVATAFDNERIQFDPATLSWVSDFRGQASGHGRCEPAD